MSVKALRGILNMKRMLAIKIDAVACDIGCYAGDESTNELFHSRSLSGIILYVVFFRTWDAVRRKSFEVPDSNID